MNAVWSLLRVSAGAALFYGAQGLAPVAWMMWIAPLPLMLYRDLGWRRAGLEALSAAALGGLVWWPYLSSMAPVPVAVLAILQPALVTALGMLLMRLARRRQRPVLATLMLALTVVSAELLVTTLSPHGSFGSIAYTQAGYLPLMQLVSVTSLAGVTALLCWVPAALSALWWRRDMALWLAGPPVVVLAAVLVAGQQRLSQPAPGKTVRVALLADDQQLRFYNKPDMEQQVLSDYAVQIAAAAGEGARIVLLPEKTFTVAAERAPGLQAKLQALADEHHVTLVAGVNLTGAPKRNLAWILAPGQGALHYQKRHLVPGWESGYAPGAESLLATRAALRLALVICKDMDFPATLRPYAARDLLLVPAWDFGADAWLHSRMALARSIEQGVPMARSAHEGRLTLSDAFGRVTHETSSAADRPVALAGDLTVGGVQTLYARWRDLFGWLMVGAWLLSVILLVRTPGPDQ